MKLPIFISLSLILIWGCVTQDEFIALDNRLTQMELRDAEARKNTANLASQIQTSSTSESSIRQQIASLRATTDQLNEELRKLNGQLEEIEFSSNKQREEVDALTEMSNRNNERLARIERQLNLGAAEQPSGSKITAAAPAERESPR